MAFNLKYNDIHHKIRRKEKRGEFQEYLNGIYASLLSIQYNKREFFTVEEIREFTGLVEKLKEYGEKL